MRFIVLAAAAALLAGPALAADGAAIYGSQCKACHGDGGKGGPAGPPLKGVAGRRIASTPGFAYSAGLKAKGGVWTDASLDAFLANPSAFAPATRMFARVAQPADRAAVIAYLKTLK